MNKQDLINRIAAAETKFSKADIKTIIDSAFAHIQESLAQGNEAVFIGFGTFKVTHREARTGRNPKTGEPIDIAASNTVTFKVGKALKESVNA